MIDYTLGIPILNKPELLYKLLESIPSIHFPKKLIIIDNGKNEIDFERPKLKRYILEGVDVKVINTFYNWGVSKSWNYIINESIDEHPVMISNSDIIFSNNTVKQFYDTIQSGYKFVWLKRGYSLFMITKECINSVGYFDENFYPAYVEDLDYAKRILLCEGLKVESLECSDVFHGNGSTVGNDHESPLAYFIRECRDLNNKYYHKKWGDNNDYILPFNKESLSYWTLDKEIFLQKIDIWNKYMENKIDKNELE